MSEVGINHIFYSNEQISKNTLTQNCKEGYAATMPFQETFQNKMAKIKITKEIKWKDFEEVLLL